MSNIIHRRDTDHEVITRLEDLPNFDLMTDDEVVAWWECNEVSAGILAALEDTDEKIDFDF